VLPKAIGLNIFEMMKKIIIFVFILVSIAHHSYAQCFKKMFDASGMDISASDLKALQDSACALQNVFPVALKDSFAVVDFGFYTFNQNMEGGYPEFMNMAEKKLATDPKTKYYLLFGRQTDSKGPNTKVWVKAKLPHWGHFKCMTEMERSLFQIRLENEVKKTTIKSSTAYVAAEKETISKMRKMVMKIVDCCDGSREDGCTKDCFTSEEIRNYLEEQGYTATPIKILGKQPTLINSDSKKSNLPRIADLCSDITSIEIDGIIYNDFPTTISHIMQAYPDEIGEAKISDDDCLCKKDGGLEWFKVGPSADGPQRIRLVIHISKGILGIPGQEQDIIYSKIFAPYELGTLPFNAYMPNRISESESVVKAEHLGSLDMQYAKSTVESIFSKNGINLSSVSLLKPVEPYKEFDIYNELTWMEFHNSGSSGRSSSIFNSMPDPNHFKYGGGNFVEFYYFNSTFSIFSNKEHFNYGIGHHLAHELLHQMIGMSLGYFTKYNLSSSDPNIYSFLNGSTAGHVNDQLNLHLEGAYFNANGNVDPCTFITNQQKAQLHILDKWQGQMKYLVPKKISNEYQQMEQISPGYKTLFTCLKIMRSLEETYNKSSPEIICGSKLLVNTIKKMKLHEYNGF
jgi:hypothetical protein